MPLNRLVGLGSNSWSRPGGASTHSSALYPDVIESGHGYSGQAANIKLHHNVGGLPSDMDFELIEPLRNLFKDEVRQLGEVLGLPSHIVWRHPFPGPGLAVRVIGDVTHSLGCMLSLFIYFEEGKRKVAGTFLLCKPYCW